MNIATWGIEEMKLIVTSIITIIAAGFGITIQKSMKKIAERQAETAREAKEIAAQAKEVANAKLNLDLFEKRMVIFEQAWNLICYAAQGKFYDISQVNMLTSKLHEAGFLFGNDIESYLVDLRSKAFEEQQLLAKIKEGGVHVDQAVRDRHMALKDWFAKESKEMRTPFLPYMSFDKWKAK
jgi:hypothetical protein